MIRALSAHVHTGFPHMKVSTLRALSPADGRYADKVDALRDLFSEYGLIRYRVLVEVRWLQWLSDHPDITELPPLSSVMKGVLNNLVDDFSLDDAERVYKGLLPDYAYIREPVRFQKCSSVSPDQK